MAMRMRLNEKTPNGGAYSEIYFLDGDRNPVDEEEALHCVIRECLENGEVINEIWGLTEKGEKLLRG